jgi:triphosphoribosyl-dephospho-CoA synthase
MTLASLVRTPTFAQKVDDLAIAALTAELACYPKPGLVSFQDCGSHADMDAATFIASIDSLRGYFADMAYAGCRAADFEALNRIGRAAERKMLVATNGVNTHRGAVFSLGLLAAAVGYTVRGHLRLSVEQVCRQVGRLWGAEMLATSHQCRGTNGADVRRRYGVPGAREHAASGFPTLRRHSIPALRRAKDAGLNRNWSGVHAFLTSLSVLDDTNLLHRGGAEALAHAQQRANEVLLLGGAITTEGRDAARMLHDEFVAAWLSPGGSADMLALCYFLTDIETIFEG